MKPLTPAERIQIKREVEQGIIEAINLGLLKVVGEDASGKTLFALTEKGAKHTESLAKVAKAADVPTQPKLL